MNNKLVLILSLSTLAAGTIQADTSSEQLWGRSVNPKVYPFIPMNTSEIYGDVERISEDKNFIKNFNDILRLRLSSGEATTKPWTASYWPLAKGTIADPYENSKVPYYLDFARTWKYQWRASWKSFRGRKIGTHKSIDRLNDSQLAMLAPSEKYDLLLGDKSFDLTNRLMTYMKDYGRDNLFYTFDKVEDLVSEKSLEEAKNYVDWFPNDYKDIKEAFQKHIVLKTRLDVIKALELVESGLYGSLEEAMPEAIRLASGEKENYVVVKKFDKNIAAWEGICNGWSTAAGLIPRPSKSVSFKLPDGRNLKFYPSDIKGLVSLYWVNSLIQDELVSDKETGERISGGTINVGKRCNLETAKKDSYGRVYDHIKDPISKKHEARCVGVHPAKWHLGLVNLMGKQGRNFVVERKVDSEVDNHPMKNYSMKYFNPYNGKTYSNVNKNLVRISKKDQFFNYRSPKTVFLVGVETVMGYLDYRKPNRANTDHERYDLLVKKKMFYDLELDADLNIVGGQWRAKKVGKPRRLSAGNNRSTRTRPKHNHNQPDFFWAITKNWKKSGLFDNLADIKKWDNKNMAPPKEWLESAKKAHSFEYKNSTTMFTGKSCEVRNKITGKRMAAWCEHSTNRPQPLSNVVNKLIELSK